MLMKAVHGTRRYEIFAIPPVSDSDCLSHIDKLISTNTTSKTKHNLICN